MNSDCSPVERGRLRSAKKKRFKSCTKCLPGQLKSRTTGDADCALAYACVCVCVDVCLRLRLESCEQTRRSKGAAPADATPGKRATAMARDGERKRRWTKTGESKKLVLAACSFSSQQSLAVSPSISSPSGLPLSDRRSSGLTAPIPTSRSFSPHNQMC